MALHLPDARAALLLKSFAQLTGRPASARHVSNGVLRAAPAMRSTSRSVSPNV